MGTILTNPQTNLLIYFYIYSLGAYLRQFVSSNLNILTIFCF